MVLARETTGRDRTRRFRNGYLPSRNHGLVCKHRGVIGCPDATTTLETLRSWLEDYNESQPHSDLTMLSHRESIRANSSPTTFTA